MSSDSTETFVTDHDADAAEALRQRLVDFPEAASAQARDELCRDVWAFVDETKALGWPPEKVIVVLKAIARDAGFPPVWRCVAPSLLDRKARLLLEMVAWCVERFFQPAVGWDVSLPHDPPGPATAELSRPSPGQAELT